MDAVVSPEERLARPSAASRIADLLQLHGLLVAVVAVVVTVVVIRLPREVSQDTWLAVLSGKIVWHSWVPGHDTLTYWTAGRPWVDQQWLAQLGMYGLYAAGGMVLLGLAHAILFAGAIGGAAAFARRSGAAARTVAWLLVPMLFSIMPGVGNVRTQTLALPLFVLVLALLVQDVRTPSRRVFAILPILVLWANIHGSVAIGVVLVLLRAAVAVRGGVYRLRMLGLAAAALASPLLTPYGTDVVGYYRHTVLNPAFGRLVTEWQPLTPHLTTAPIFAVMAAVVWLLTRRAREAGAFAILVELMLAALALLAIRNAVWFGLGSVILLARPLDAELRGRELGMRRLNAGSAVAASLLLAVSVAALVKHGSPALVRQFPARGGSVVAAAVRADPHARVFASERLADWLILEHPSLAGRVAYDARFELLSAQQLLRVYEWRNQMTDQWRAAAAGSRVVVLDLTVERKTEVALRRTPGMHEAYRDRYIAVFVRS